MNTIYKHEVETHNGTSGSVITDMRADEIVNREMVVKYHDENGIEWNETMKVLFVHDTEVLLCVD